MPHSAAPSAPPPEHRADVVVIGAGFAGLEAAKGLGRAGIDTIVVDRHNHHLFQPLLYQVATAALSATDVAEPIRSILRPHRSVQVMFGEVVRVDAKARLVELTGGTRIGWRVLIVAAGASHGYFGHDDWARWAPGLKTAADALRIRSRLLLTFEQAERCTDAAERQRLLSVLIVGGGPTGVEMAGSIAELSRFTLARDFRAIDPTQTRVTLVEAGPRLLPGFSDRAADFALRRLQRLGVEVRTGTAVEGVGPRSARLAGEEVPAGLVIWAAGVAAAPLAAQLGTTDRAGRIAVEPTLAVPGLDGVYALGDIAACTGADGKPLPGLAQVAKQQGRHMGRQIAALLRSGIPPAPFRYRSRGNTAIVGRNAAIFETDRYSLRGWFAWLAWAVIHIYLLAGFQNRFLVSMQWLWRYLTYQRGARMIVGSINDDPEAAAAPGAESARHDGEPAPPG